MTQPGPAAYGFAYHLNKIRKGAAISTAASRCAQRIPLRWRDLDHQGHVYHATLLTLLDEARTCWLADELGVTTPDSYVVVRMEIDYRSELTRADESVDVEVGVTRIGHTSLTLVESAIAHASGALVAETITTIVMWDRANSKRRPITAAERARAEHLLAQDEVGASVIRT